ncbi:MAG TPA: hypothetical protein VHG08_15345 [Longimicrobium sp.]|nr:hypothetical protein [Longimicrobium sp.]
MPGIEKVALEDGCTAARMVTMPLLLIAGLLPLAACDWMQPRVERPPVQEFRVPPPPLEALVAAPETIVVGDVHVAAAATLWIDRMPGPAIEGRNDPPGDPLQGHFDVHSVDGRPLPRGLRLEGAWLVGADSVWPLAVAPSDTSRAGSPWIARRARGVPVWPGEQSADLVVRLGRPDGTSQLVRTRSVPVTVAE